MDWYTAGWAAWAAGFILLEGKALRDKDKDDTLSEHVWRLFGVHNGWRWNWRRYFLTAFMVWLFGHFVFGIWSF